MLAGDDPLPARSETETINETDVEEKGSSQNTYPSYHVTIEHYHSDSDYSVTEASSTEN